MSKSTARTLIVLGSGGHTAEMVEIVKHLDQQKYTPRLYVLAKTDSISRNKIEEIENSESHEFHEIFRSREVKQSYFTSIFTTVLAILYAFRIVYKLQPELVLCNGPGTCVPICLVAFIFRHLYLIPKTCKIVFIESYCRVKTISLSGKILKNFTDMFIVQWPELHSNTSKYYGRLI